MVIARFPVVDLVFGNLVAALFSVSGDLAAWHSNVALDLPVMAAGLLLSIVMAAAMRMALRLDQDGLLTF